MALSSGKKEEQLYEPIRDTLRNIFRQYLEKEIKAKEEVMREPMSFLWKNVYLEITANGHFSEMLKEQLDDRALSIIRVEKFSPDIMGFVQKTSSSKKELITGLQQALLDGWLLFVDGLDRAFEEFRNAEWLDGDEAKIRNSTKYHILDAIQYMVDNLPHIAEPNPTLTSDQEIMKKHRETMNAEAMKKKALEEYKKTGRKKFTGHLTRSRRWKR